MTPIMGRYAVYCIYHRYTIIVHRIEMKGILKLLESYKWKRLLMGINPEGIGFNWKIPSRLEMDLDRVEAEYAM